MKEKKSRQNMKKETDRHFKQDINLLEYPLWMQDEKLPSKISDDKGFIWKDREGYVYRCGYKVPTKLDIIYLMYLLYRSQQEGWKEEIEISRYEILKACGYRSCRPADYERLEDSLDRWKMVGIRFQGTFYDGKKYIALSFGVIDTWKIDEETKRLRIRFNLEWLTRIKNSSYFKYLNFDQIRSLRSPLAMRLYEILSKSFQNREYWKVDALKLARKIPMKERAVAHIVSRIKAAINRINNNSNMKVRLTIKRPTRGRALLLFERMPLNFEGPFIIEQDQQEDELKLEEILALIPPCHRQKKTLLERVRKTFYKKGAEYVKRNILYANEKVNQPGKYRSFLEKALREDWARGWWEDRLGPLQEKKEIPQAPDEEEWRLREKVEQMLVSLPPEERRKLQEKARQQLPEALREIEGFVRMQMRFLLRRKLLTQEKISQSPVFQSRSRSDG